MKYSTWKDKNLSKLCFGCEPLGGTDWGELDIKEIESAVHRSIELGLNFFDTADIYGLGQSEIRLSNILGSKRSEMFIATKGGVSWKETSSRASTKLNLDPEYIRKAAENSLKRLRIDTIPLYYIHWPDPTIDMRATFEVLSCLKDQGKIQHIGCSNFNIDQLRILYEISSIDFLQIPVNLLNGLPDQSLINFCKTNSINIVAYNVLASGLLTGKYNEQSSFTEEDRRSRTDTFSKNNFIRLNALKQQAELESKSILEHSLKWIFNNNSVEFAITGIKNKYQIEENISLLY